MYYSTSANLYVPNAVADGATPWSPRYAGQNDTGSFADSPDFSDDRDAPVQVTLSAAAQNLLNAGSNNELLAVEEDRESSSEQDAATAKNSGTAAGWRKVGAETTGTTDNADDSEVIDVTATAVSHLTEVSYFGGAVIPSANPIARSYGAYAPTVGTRISLTA